MKFKEIFNAFWQFVTIPRSFFSIFLQRWNGIGFLSLFKTRFTSSTVCSVTKGWGEDSFSLRIKYYQKNIDSKIDFFVIN
ncbi:hypothetical protein BpHYR1_019223 [Brachionus plicatilis]|uniref:Uncharacterized protein n=1 Tax=Brachionus plicatilis TaxID=10195 RepID=A0A3M7QI40_BRAPC|nr:hypothetical protein BpHYR1_019223 [Brachionus plicatilis]